MLSTPRRACTLALVTLLVLTGAVPVLASMPGTDVVIPVIARLQGVGDPPPQYYSTIWITNQSATEPASVMAQLYQRDATANPVATAPLVLQPGETRRIDNSVETLFGLTGAAGSLRLVSTQPVLATTRSYDLPAGSSERDTKGLSLGAIPVAFAIGSGETTELHGVAQTSEVRYNFGAVETSGAPVTIRATVVDGGGAVVGTRDYALPAHGQIQHNVVDITAAVSGLANGRLEITVVSGAGAVLAYGAYNTNASQDGTGFEMALATDKISGPTGPTGPEGATGPQGLQGPEGPAGETGPRGFRGPTGAAGPTGPVGPQGIVGPTGPTGPRGLNWQSTAWDVATTYGLDDAVSRLGSSYVSLTDGNVGNPPESNPASWALLAAAGTTGPVGTTGAAGPSGPSGPSGPQGLVGPSGPSGPSGPQGLVGPSGPSGPSGPQGLVGPSGPSGPSGPQGLVGPSGPSGPSGPTGPAGSAGLVVTDNTGQTLGKLLAISDSGVSVLTSNGYWVDIQWDGTFPVRQIYFQNDGCTGSFWLNAGGSVGRFMWGKHAVGDDGYVAGNTNASAGLAVPKTVNADGVALSADFSARVLKNYTNVCPASGSNMSNSGWELQSISISTVGLPATITPPLHVQ